MQLYAILRRSGWRSPEELQEAAGRSTKVGDEDMPDDVRWIRSYVLEEGGGSVGTVCIYQATSPEAIRKHASLADLPVDEIVAVADLTRPDGGVLELCRRAPAGAAKDDVGVHMTPRLDGRAGTLSAPGGLHQARFTRRSSRCRSS